MTQSGLAKLFPSVMLYSSCTLRQGAAMRRREFITFVGSAVAWPLAARAQQPAMPVVGYLGSETPEKFGIRVTAFLQGLSTMGYDDGRNVKI
jgi:putative ABC transport system substrate-binding protein